MKEDWAMGWQRNFTHEGDTAPADDEADTEPFYVPGEVPLATHDDEQRARVVERFEADKRAFRLDPDTALAAANVGEWRLRLAGVCEWAAGRLYHYADVLAGVA